MVRRGRGARARVAPAIAGLLLVACGTDGTLVVQIRTDLTPGREFARAQVRVTDPSGGVDDVTSAASDHRAWGAGVRAGELGGLAPGRYRVLARLERADGSVAVERAAQVDVRAGLRVATLLLTRSCGGVVCPALGDAPDATACLAGRCVNEACIEEAAGCGGGCRSAEDCAGLPVSSCARLECTPSGSCLAAPDHAACGDGRVCDPSGCVTGEEACAVWGPWSPPMPEASVNTADREYGASLSPDRLALYFTRDVGGRNQILVARRATPSGPFGAAAPVPALEAMEAGEPSISASGRTLLFVMRPQSVDPELWTAPIDAEGEVGAPAPLAFTPLDGEPAFGPDLTADELVLAFGSNPNVTERIALAERSDPSAPFGPPAPIEAAAMAGYALGRPSISGDGLEVVFEAQTVEDPYLDLFVMRRPTREAPFGAPVPISELDAPGVVDGDPDVSHDGSTIYFTSTRTGDLGAWDLWFSTRECL